jgi:hypothetical protein
MMRQDVANLPASQNGVRVLMRCLSISEAKRGAFESVWKK